MVIMLKERQSSDHVDHGNREGEKFTMVASTSKYEFLYRKGISGFIEEPKTQSYTVHELRVGSNDSTANCNGGNSVSGKIQDAESPDPVIHKDLEKWQQEKEDANENHETDHLLADGQKVENMEHEIHERSTSIACHETPMKGGPINDSDDEFIEMEPQSAEDISTEKSSMVSPEKPKDDSEFASEHDDLIEQLKMELKTGRNGGLPTILEESESPKMVQELGPLQIDEKYEHKDHMAEIQKVYKSYSDKMRKLDILNSQTMHAFSLLQQKDPVGPSSKFGKSPAPSNKALLSRILWPFKQQKTEADPAMKLIRDLHKDFEKVYVGQVCLSWEILHWQYGKVKKLLERDSHGSIHHQYNQVAGEFQHFQVLMQRFLEDEPFRAGSRVENYVKNRCALRFLLQVPVIKDDCSNYKEDTVSSEIMLTDIIEESMHVFWEFLRADKDESNATSKIPQQARVAPHDPIDLELMVDVRTELHKKEKKLKEMQRSTNCMIKKFQRQHQGNLLDLHCSSLKLS
ncbi:hypothetical protein DITRI_Ditri02bG0188000 [Diplodiscus trichospermus]